MDVNAVIAEATKVAEQAPASPQEAETKAPQEVVKEESVEDIGKKPDSELTPEQLEKRKVNRQSHLDSKLARMRRENREYLTTVQKLSEEIQRLKSSPQSSADKAPDPKDFEDYGEYLKADARYAVREELKKELSDRENKSKESAKTQAFDAHKEERLKDIAQMSQDFAKATPEFQALVQEHQEYFQGSLPEVVEAALLEAENPVLAIYALMKEGKLEALEDMSPYKISMEIGKAELRALNYLNQNKATNAPTPIKAAKGTGKIGKSLEDMSVPELMDKYVYNKG